MRASGYDRVGGDWYVEPDWAVDALIAAERPFIGPVVDPCCGGGNIPRQLKAAHVNAWGTDIVDRGGSEYEPVDFFADTSASWHWNSGITCIVSNPPYNRAQEFVERSLNIATDRVCVLLRLAFLEGQGRQAWLEASPLARIHVSSRRMSMPPGGTGVKASGGAIAYGWFVWEHGWKGAPEVRWLPSTRGVK